MEIKISDKTSQNFDATLWASQISIRNQINAIAGLYKNESTHNRKNISIFLNNFRKCFAFYNIIKDSYIYGIFRISKFKKRRNLQSSMDKRSNFEWMKSSQGRTINNNFYRLHFSTALTLMNPRHTKNRFDEFWDR